MSQDDLSHFVPRRLDDGGKFLFWDLDVAAVAVIGMLVGVAAEFRVLGLILGLVMAYWYNKLKTGQHPGMANHLLYWFTGVPAPKAMPASHLRELIG